LGEKSIPLKFTTQDQYSQQLVQESNGNRKLLGERAFDLPTCPHTTSPS
jgi:hypothetical protein